MPAPLQRRVLARGAEVPGVVVRVDAAVTIRVVVVPIGVDVRPPGAVRGGRLQGAGGLGRAAGAGTLPRGRAVPVGRRGAAATLTADQRRLIFVVQDESLKTAQVMCLENLVLKGS